MGWTPEPHQFPPSPPWDVWALVAGRGSGKTDADAYYVDRHVSGPPCIPGPVPHRVGIIAPTHEDAKKTCVVGDSGILQHNRRIKFTPGGKAGDLIWPNGSVGNLFGAFTPEDIERLRGPQHCLVWCEEMAAWRYLTPCWDNMQFGLRLGAHPHVVANTTPKGRPDFWAIVESPGVIVQTATTDDNPHLHPRVRQELYRKYGGTRLGQQELFAQRLTDVPGALWTRAMIAYGDAPSAAIKGVVQPDYQKMVVAIDPAVTYGPDSDETGIVVGAVGSDGHGYVLDDRSGRYPPDGWAKLAVALYHEHKADRIVAESNNGGEMVRLTIQTVDSGVPVSLVTATRGKRTRAEPIASLYEQGRIKHLRPFTVLEDQLCNFTPDTILSPDRLDALVWAFTELMLDEVGGQYSMIA